MLSNSQTQSPQVLFSSPPLPQPPPQPSALAQLPQPQQKFPQFYVKWSLKIKKKAIIDNYKVVTQVLGLGINGKVLQIFKRTQEKFALKMRKSRPTARD